MAKRSSKPDALLMIHGGFHYEPLGDLILRVAQMKVSEPVLLASLDALKAAMEHQKMGPVNISDCKFTGQP